MSKKRFFIQSLAFATLFILLVPVQGSKPGRSEKQGSTHGEPAFLSRVSPSYFISNMLDSRTHTLTKTGDLLRFKNGKQLQSFPQQPQPAILSLPRSNYTLHDPIGIAGDGGFTPENGVISGDGTAENPFLIQGWEITSSYTPAIDIRDTRAHFIIRDCMLSGYPAAVLGGGITNGTFEKFSITCELGAFFDYGSDLLLNSLTLTCDEAVFFSDSSNITIQDCTTHPYSMGSEAVYAQLSTRLTIANLSASSFADCIQLFNCPNTRITDCHLYANDIGLGIVGCPYTTLRNNSLNDNHHSLDIEGLTEPDHDLQDFFLDIDTTNIIDGKPILYLRNSSHITLNDSTDIGYLGLVQCTHITVNNLTIGNVTSGVLLAGTTNTTIESCRFPGTWYGAALYYSPHNTIRDMRNINLTIIRSPFNLLRNVSMTGGWLDVEGEHTQDFIQDIDTSNTINGKTVYYLVGMNNRLFTVPDPGYLAFVDCHNILIRNVNMTDGVIGLTLAQSTALISHCTFDNNGYGIYATCNSTPVIINTRITNNMLGIVFDHAISGRVHACTFTGNGAGIDIADTTHTIITSSTLTDNWNSAIQIDGHSTDNIISLNHMTNDTGWGVVIDGNCSDNQICDNTITDQAYGIIITNSEHPPCDNTITRNILSDNIEAGIALWDNIENRGIDHNIISHNNITTNTLGIDLFFTAPHNLISHNNIHANTIGLQADTTTINCTNNWWGTPDGPAGIGNGTGDPITTLEHTTATYTPWLQQPAHTTPNKIHALLIRLFTTLP